MAEAESSRRGRSDAARLLLAAARERFAVAATDLLLPAEARLSEWQRVTAAALLGRLVRSVEDELRIRLAASFASHDALHAALGSARVAIALPILERAQVLRDSELTTLLVRRVEEHRFWAAAGPGRSDQFLNELVRDANADIATEAMELVIARSRRFDRFQEPALGAVELPAELQHRLIWMVAAALRHYIVEHHRIEAVDGAVEEAASALVSAYDEGRSLEALAMRLARRLDRSGRLDGRALSRMIGDGVLPFFIAGLAVRCALDPAAVWELLSDPDGRGAAVLLRAAGVERDQAAEILFGLNLHGPLFSAGEGDAATIQLELFDNLDPAKARDLIQLWQAHPAYRASVARISTRSRPVAGEAA